ncbi:hypothetical protein LTR85_009032 [Meristemomyces frigidus]|nr:hypothetical protein LTR85_009032 [Meristemomyces frigidus]
MEAISNFSLGAPVRLPLELRIAIYNNVFEGGAVITLEIGVNDREEDLSARLPMGVLVHEGQASHQLQNEIRSVFIEAAIF